jgi:hypothetical protein
VLLIFTLVQHPEGVAGAFYKRLHSRRAARGPAGERVFAPSPAGEP